MQIGFVRRIGDRRRAWEKKGKFILMEERVLGNRCISLESQ